MRRAILLLALFVAAPLSAQETGVTRITDGTYQAGVTSTGYLKIDFGAGAGHVIIDSSAAIAVTGTFWPTTAALPGSVRLSTGAAFYNALQASDTLTAVTTITNPVTVTDGAGALNVIVDSGSINVSNSVLAAAVNIQDGGNSITVDGTVGVSNAFALEATQLTGNTSLASVKTNTDPLVTAGSGGYMRQDSTATIAKESGGNLATVAALSKAEDASHASGDPGVLSLAVRNDTAAALTSADGDYSPVAVDSHGHTYVRVMGRDADTENNAVVTAFGALLVSPVVRPSLPLQPCNPVRRTNCQAKNF